MPLSSFELPYRDLSLIRVGADDKKSGVSRGFLRAIQSGTLVETE